MPKTNFPTVGEISAAAVKVGAMQFGEILRLRSDLAAANAVIAEQKQQLQAARQQEQATSVTCPGCDGGVEHRQLVADHKLAMAGIEKLRASFDEKVTENVKLRSALEEERLEHSQTRGRLILFEKSDKAIKNSFETLRDFGGGYPDCYPEGAKLDEAVYVVCNKLEQRAKAAERKLAERGNTQLDSPLLLRCPLCGGWPTLVGYSGNWSISCCGVGFQRSDRDSVVDKWNCYVKEGQQLALAKKAQQLKQATQEPTEAADYRKMVGKLREHATRPGNTISWPAVDPTRQVNHGSRSDANWPTVDGAGRPLERVIDGYAHSNGDVSMLTGEAVAPATFLGPRECPKHGKWGCMCPREPEPKGPAVRRGTGRSPKVEM